MHDIKSIDIVCETSPRELIWKCLVWLDVRVGDRIQETLFGQSCTRNDHVSDEQVTYTLETLHNEGVLERLPGGFIQLKVGLCNFPDN